MLECRGTLCLVVGPSGAGKDTLIDGARLRFRHRDIFSFPQRVITRPAGVVGEAHSTVDEQSFTRAQTAGHFLLSWNAHGLAYAIPASARGCLEQGKTVVVNVSRRVISQAEELVSNLAIVEVTASPAILAERLKARGREAPGDVASRLARAEAVVPSRARVLTIVNDGAKEDSIARFCNYLDSIQKGKLPVSSTPSL